MIKTLYNDIQIKVPLWTFFSNPTWKKESIKEQYDRVRLRSLVEKPHKKSQDLGILNSRWTQECERRDTTALFLYPIAPDRILLLVKLIIVSIHADYLIIRLIRARIYTFVFFLFYVSATINASFSDSILKFDVPSTSYLIPIMFLCRLIWLKWVWCF